MANAQHASNVRSKESRFGIAMAIGAAAGLYAAWLSGQWDYAVLSAWDGLALTLLALVWRDFRGHSAESTARLARHDNLGQSATDVVLLVASVASLGAVISLLGGHQHSLAQVGFALGSIVISWTTVHMLHMLKYAVMYYDGRQDGIDFGGKDQPTFADFAYVAFTIGMTYQVSDTTFTSTRFRRAALGHAVLSFVFGTAIIATSINFLAGLGK